MAGGKRKTSADGGGGGGGGGYEGHGDGRMKKRTKKEEERDKSTTADTFGDGENPAPQARVVNHPHTLSRVEKEYMRWMRSKGVKLDGVSIGHFPRTGRGCVALRDIEPGDVVVEVPADAIITAETSVAGPALACFFGDGGEKESPRLEREALVLAVMAEMSMGASSDFAPYLAALPTLRATHSPLAWSGAELAELEGTSTLNHMMTVEDESLELPSMTAAHWKHVAKPFLAANPIFARPLGDDDEEGEEDNEEDEEDVDEDEVRKMYLFATALVAGFSFTLGEEDDDNEEELGGGEGEEEEEEEDHHKRNRSHLDDDDDDDDDGGGGGVTQAMVPFWDMLNHRPPADANVRLNHDPDTDMLQMIATRRVPAGAEVFNTYGPVGDAELLRRYGFVTRRNPHGGGVEVGVRELMAAAAVGRYTAETEAEEMNDGLENSDNDDNSDDSDDSNDYGMPPDFSDLSDDDDSDDDEEEGNDSDDDDDDDDDEEEEEEEGVELGLGELSRGQMLERLRWLRRRGILADSKVRFHVSRTGRPSLALRHAARVFAMHPFQFRRLLAADAYERGDRDDQRGAYSDEEEDDDEEDGFAGFKPLSVKQVWDGAVIAGEACFFVAHSKKSASLE